MSEIIAILSRKGGSGKTTTALCLADQLRQHGRSVLLIDLDAKRNCSKALNADLTRANVTNLLDGAKLSDVVQHTENGDIVAASIYLNAADAILKSNTILKKALANAGSLYDFVLCDCPDTPGRLVTNALVAADSAIITVKAEPFSYDGIDDLADVINQAQELNENLIIRGIVVTAYDGRSNAAKRNLEDFRRKAVEIGTSVIDPPIRATSKVYESQGERVNLSQFAPKCTAALDYKSITEQLLEQ